MSAAQPEDLSPVSAFPDQAVDEYGDSIYFRTLRFIASQWNIRNTSFIVNPTFNLNAGNVNGAFSDQQIGFAKKYIQNVQYIFGNQVISTYGFFVKDESGNDIRTPMFRGMDITKYYNTMDGEWRDMIDFLPKMINVSGRSENVLSKKKMMQDALKARVEHDQFYQLMQELSGFQFNPIDQNYENQYFIQKKIESFQEGMEIAYQQIAVDTTYRNNYRNLLAKGNNYVFIGGMAMMDIYMHNNRVKWHLVPPHKAIFDSSKDDDQHLLDDYGGEVFEVSVADVLSRWEWTTDEIKDIKDMASNNNNWSVYNTYTNINGLAWWQIYNGVPKICCVKGKWRSMEKVNGKWAEVVREGILIGNKYLRDQKISDTQIWNKHNDGRRELGYITVTPNTLLGCVVSVVDMVKRFQDLKDAFTTKMIDLVASSIGKSYFINANKLPEGLRTPQLISQLKQAKVVVMEGADIDEEDSDKLQKLIEPIDLSLDPGISIILQLIQYYDNVIADILNIPATARGQMSQYLPKDVVSSNIQQSNKGLKWYYGSMFNWVQRILEYSADLAKIVMPETLEGQEQLSLIIGDSMTTLLSMETLREMQFEDFLLNLDPKDIITEDDEREIKSFAAQLAGAGALSMRDFIKIKRLNNMAELENYFEEKEIQAQQREEAAAQVQQQSVAQNAEVAAQTQKDVTNAQIDGKLQETAMKEQGANMRELLKSNEPTNV